MRTIAVSWGYAHGEIEREKPDFIAHTTEDVVKIILK